MAGTPHNVIFSSKCGQNVKIDGNSVEWCSVNSGGRLYIETALQPNAQVVLKLTGSGHADIGILTKNPMSCDPKAVDNMKELTVMQTARIHKQDGTISIRRSEDGCQVSTISEQPNNNRIRQKDEIWITVNIIFGSLKVKIESRNYRFALHKGSNITLNEDRSMAGLTYENPSAVCFLQNPIKRGKTAYFHIMPIMKDGKISRNFATKLAVSDKNPEQFIPPNQEFYDITCLDVTHADQLKRKTKQEVKVRLAAEGSVEVITENGKSFVLKENTTSTYILFDLCRVKVKYMGTISADVNNQNVADAVIPYFIDPNFIRSKTDVSLIQRDIYNLSIGSSDENTSNHGEEHGEESARSEISEHYSVFTQRLQEIEDNVNQYENENQKQLSAENFEFLQAENRVIQSDIQAIKECLQQLISHIQHKDSQAQPAENPNGQTSTSQLYSRTSGIIEDQKIHKPRCQTLKQLVPKLPNTDSLKDMIQKNFVDLVNNIEPFPFCDHLYQNDIITQYEFEEFRISIKSSKMETNRDILSKLIIRNIDPSKLRSILEVTKQKGVLAKLFA